MQWLRRLFKRLGGERVTVTATEVVAGTIWAEVLSVLQSGNFDPMELNEAAEDEIELGEMNALEKAVFTLIDIKVSEAQKVVVQGQGQHTEDESCPICQKLRLLKSQIEALKSLGWLLIRQRLGLWEETSIGLRTGFKVIRCSEGKPKRVRTEITIMTSAGGLPPELAMLGQLFGGGDLPPELQIIERIFRTHGLPPEIADFFQAIRRAGRPSESDGPEVEDPEAGGVPPEEKKSEEAGEPPESEEKE